MSNNYLQIYIDSTFDLAETLVVKSDYAANELNKYVATTHPGSFDKEDRRTWKYYLNIAGEYHSSDKDIIVRSLDTLEEIKFTKENLKLHRATYRSYQYNTRYYRELIIQYPEYERLILGVLYPCDIDEAIQAEDYSILSYPSHLVEEYELMLIPKLEAWIKRYMQRWNNQQYRISDDLYEAGLLGIMHLNTVTALLNLRLEAAKTEEVHSFYIKQYFASNGYLDKYLNSLNRRQILFLYRNLPWIMRNAGKNNTFRTLIDKILVEKNIPLVSYRMTHDIKDILDTLESLPRFKQISENKITFVNEEEYAVTRDILFKQDKLAKENPDVRVYESEVIENELKDSLSNRLQTKSLESNMYDYSDSGPYRLTEVLLDHWVYLTYHGKYNSYVQIMNPTTGVEFPIHVKDAFLLANFLGSYAKGYRLTTIPVFTVKRVQRLRQPTTEQLLGIVDSEKFDAQYVEQMTRYRPVIDTVISTEAFYSLCSDIHLSMKHQRLVTAYHEDFKNRGMAQAMHSFMYGTRECDLADTPDQLYSLWFQDRNIEINDFLIDDIIDTIYNEIVNKATGLDLGSNRTIKNIQFDMIKMMEQLSSYSVHYLRNINSSSIEIADWPVIRPSEPITHAFSNLGLVEIDVDPLKTVTNAKVVGFIDLDNLVDIIKLEASFDAKHHVWLPPLIGRNWQGRYSRREYHFVKVNDIVVRTNIDQDKYKETGMIPVPGIDQYLLLDNKQRRSIPEIKY